MGSDPREGPASTPAATTTTPAADFCRSGEALEYGADTVVVLWNLDAARGRVIDLLEEIVEDNNGVISTEHSVRIGTEMAAFEQEVSKISALRPPQELQPAHQLLEESAAVMMEFSTALQTGVFLNNSEQINEAADHWERAQNLRESYEERKQELCTS